MKNNRKGYRVERKIRLLFERYKWNVVRSGGSFGQYDLIAFKNKRALFIQVKSTNKDVLYYYGYMKDKIYGFPFLLIVDFGRNNIRVTRPKAKVNKEDGIDIYSFLKDDGNSFQ